MFLPEREEHKAFANVINTHRLAGASTLGIFVVFMCECDLRILLWSTLSLPGPCDHDAVTGKVRGHEQPLCD